MCQGVLSCFTCLVLAAHVSTLYTKQTFLHQGLLWCNFLLESMCWNLYKRLWARYIQMSPIDPGFKSSGENSWRQAPLNNLFLALKQSWFPFFFFIASWPYFTPVFSPSNCDLRLLKCWAVRIYMQALWRCHGKYCRLHMVSSCSDAATIK